MKIFTVVLYFILVVLSFTANAETNVEARISAADERFNQVVKDSPEKEIQVTLFFANDMSLEDLRNIFRKQIFVIKGFRHGTQSYAGGYGLKSGETFEEAIENYKRDHLFFLETRISAEEKMLTTQISDDLRKAITTHWKEASQMKLDFNKYGIRIIGIEVIGRAQALDTFRENNPFVRVIELKDQNKPQSPLIP